MKNSLYTVKRKKMEKFEFNLLKILSIGLLIFIIHIGYASNSDISKINRFTDGTIACNDTVNICMDLDCITEITPDQLLEGNYPDFGIFEVNVYDQNDNPIGNTVTKDHVGFVLVAEVIDTTNGNKCWSYIDIYDKAAPPLVCDTIFTTCYLDPIPGTNSPHNFRFAYELDEPIPDADTLKYPFEVGKIAGAHMTDVNIILGIEHENDIDLAAYLVSPENDTVELFNTLTCGNANFYVEFDDQADKTDVDLTNECTPNDPAINGTFQPTGNLSDFNGEVPSGTWTIVIIDKTQSNTGSLKYLALLFKQNGGYINFPIPQGSSTPIETGKYEYVVESGFESCGPATLTYSDQLIDMDCSTNYTRLILRTWTATDESGNTAICTQYIYVIRTGTAFLEWPVDYDNIDHDALYCDPANPGLYPEPELTGAPGEELCDMVTISHEDQVIDICSASYKIIRHWKVSEMCSDNVYEHDQLIAVLDTTGPVLSNIPDASLPTDALECTRDFHLTLPDIISDCSDIELITWTVGYQILDDSGNPETPELLYDNIEILPDGSFFMHNAPAGKIKFTYTATDDCGNSTTITNIITIFDDDPPVAVCDEHTQVVIGTDGTAKTEAFVFDDGSHDNCSNITFKVRRMDPVCISSDQYFRDSITFCCDDVNTTQLVELQVTDESGLSNTCMVEVNVIDKLPPIIVCPENIVIQCDVDYTNLEITGKATAYDNCEVTKIEHQDYTNINQCNIGNVRRIWTAWDKNNYQSSCTQTISILDNHQFTGNDIIWPNDTTLYDCVENFDTSITGSVKFLNEDFCSMVSARYDDEVFNVIDGACSKILRHWEVIDWCNFDEEYPEESTWRYTQVIMLQNSEAPVFDETCAPRTFCTYGPCAGEITYIKTATDDCTPSEQLNWSYRVDLDNDGDWDIGPVPSNDASGVYANGTHRFAWVVEDGCGNSASCEEIVTVKDCKKPTPLCLTQTTTVLMNYGGMVTICAKDFDLGSDNCSNCNTGSYDNCTPQDDLIYSFSSNVNDTCRTLTCDDIPNGQQIFLTIEMWVTDEAGNQDYCTVYLDLEDNEANACQDTSIGSIIYGFVYNPDDIIMDNVEFKLQGSENTLYSYSDQNGRYEFTNLLLNENYNLEANKESDFLLGVTTLDLVLIQKHILGIKKFDRPYKYIAADANNSGSVSASDILAIRRAILGEDNNLSNNSWAFTPDGNEIRNNENILSSWKDLIRINKNQFGSNINWVGIKIGDINNSNSELLESRDGENVNMYLNDIKYSENEEVKADLYISNINDLTGAQFTMNFNADELIFEKIIPNSKLIDQNSIGLTNVKNGQLVVSWIKPENVSGEDKLFTIVFVSKDDGQLSDNIAITDDKLTSEAYDNELNIHNLYLEFRNIIENKGNYALYQNIPNPFVNETAISFTLPESQNATISFTDITGRVLKKVSKFFNKGKNSITVSFDDMVSGVIYYKLETGKFTATRKMINIR